MRRAWSIYVSRNTPDAIRNSEVAILLSKQGVKTSRLSLDLRLVVSQQTRDKGPRPDLGGISKSENSPLWVTGQ